MSSHSATAGSPIVINHFREVGIAPYRATDEQAKTVTLALRSFGFLLKGKALTRWSFAEFADRIAATHDDRNPKTRAIVSTLREVHALNQAPAANDVIG